VWASDVPGVEAVASLPIEGWCADAVDAALMVIAGIECVSGRVIAQAEEWTR
jgi:hypothetical protein